MELAFDAYDELYPLDKMVSSRFQRNFHPSDQVERLAKIMREQGVRQPIHLAIIDGKKTNEIAFGHGRREAAMINKWTEYPVVYQEFATEDEYYACVQSDNAIAMWSELDMSAINKDLPELGPDFDIELLGIKDFTLDPSEKTFNPDKAEDHWQDMPAYENTDARPYRSIVVHMESEEDVQAFAKAINQEFTDKTKYVYFPFKEREVRKDKAYISEE